MITARQVPNQRNVQLLNLLVRARNEVLCTTRRKLFEARGGVSTRCYDVFSWQFRWILWISTPSNFLRISWFPEKVRFLVSRTFAREFNFSEKKQPQFPVKALLWIWRNTVYRAMRRLVSLVWRSFISCVEHTFVSQVCNVIWFRHDFRPASTAEQRASSGKRFNKKKLLVIVVVFGIVGVGSAPSIFMVVIIIIITARPLLPACSSVRARVYESGWLQHVWWTGTSKYHTTYYNSIHSKIIIL